MKYWLPILLVLMLGLSWAYAQQPFIGFKCEKGICVTTEAEVDRFQEFLNMVAARLQELYGENERLKAEREQDKKRQCS